MSRDPYAPPASKEEQLAEVARILAIALKRWREDRKHRLSDDRPDRGDPDAGTPIERQSQREAAD